MNKDRYVQMTVNQFMDNFLPKNNGVPLLKETDAVMRNLEYFDPQRGDPQLEKNCYAPLVSPYVQVMCQW